jgi:LytR cell envelope-related transcriptional attenuator
MSGRHEPPTDRSFYLSLATSTLRSALIVALVVGGVVLIGQAFPKSALPRASPGATSPSPHHSPSTTPHESPSAQIVGVKIGVYNGGGLTGLAASTATKLEKRFGYVPVEIGNAPSPVSVTTLYYRTAKDKIEAQALASNFFKNLNVKIAKLPASATNVKSSVRVAIYLGSDYASTQG